MTSTYNIFVKNLSTSQMDFYVFQKPATIVSSGTPYTVVSTSLGTNTLSPYSSSGTALTFQFDTQVHAAAYSNQTSTNLVQIELFSQGSNACWPIDLTPSSGNSQVTNSTNLSPMPLGLSQPKYDQSVPQNNFGIDVPSYTPQGGSNLFCGVAIQDPNEGIILSSYVTPRPVSQVFCAPEPIYYVKVGTYAAGYIIDFSADNTALCDFTTGASACNVSYNADGTFTVT